MSTNCSHYGSTVFPTLVRNVRTWEDSHLPLSQSRISFDLFMLIGQSAVTSRPLTLKELFNSLNYSERGVRYVLEQFIDGGWCEIIGHEKDKRFRLVVATDLMRSKLHEYERYVISTYEMAFVQASSKMF
jgi:hypothetical protein